MKKDRLSFISGFFAPLCMAFMLGFEYLIDKNMLRGDYYSIAMAEIIPFLIPLLLIIFLLRLGGQKAYMPVRGFTRKAVPFVLFMSCAAALLSVLLSSGVSLIFDMQPSLRVPYVEGLDNMLTAILLVVLLPGIFEELLFRGGLLQTFAAHGTVSAIILSALMFALIHGNEANLAGPFAAGLIYGYMAYTLDSVWPAVIAHMINNAFYLIMTYVAGAYQTLGIWLYFLLIATVAFGFFLYLSMRSLEKLIEKGKIRKLARGGLRGILSGLLFTPGLWLLGLMFLIRVAYK